jgi:hypothetical protein
MALHCLTNVVWLRYERIIKYLTEGAKVNSHEGIL